MYGSFVRTVRESRGLSQDGLAAVAGVPQPNLSAIENDRRTPSAETLNRILVACGYELAAVAGGRQVFCDLPRIGWFPDEDDPGPVEGDPAGEAPVLDADATIDDRLAVIEAVFGVADDRMR